MGLGGILIALLLLIWFAYRGWSILLLAPLAAMLAAIVLGTSTFTMTAMPGTPAIQNAIPIPYFGTSPFAAPGLGMIATLIMLAFGLAWLARMERVARRRGIGYAGAPAHDSAVDTALVRERASAAREFDPAELHRGSHAARQPGIVVAVLPLLVVVAGNLVLNLWGLPRWQAGYLAEPAWGGTSLAALGGVWAVLIALALAIVCLVALNYRSMRTLRDSVDAGANAAVLPALSVASLVGFGAVVAALPAFALVREWVLTIDGGPLVSLAVATNVLAALTGSASGGLTIALQALAPTYMSLSGSLGIDPALLHRVAVIGAGTLDSLPHNGAVVSLLAVCGATHRDSYVDIFMVGIAGPVMALVTVVVLGTQFGAF